MIKKLAYIIWAVVIALGLIIFVFSPDKETNNLSSETLKVMNINKEQGKEVFAVLKQCGFDESVKIRRAADLDNSTGANEKGYYIKYNDMQFIKLLIAPNGTVYNISLPSYNIYANGQVVNPISDFILSDKDKEKLAGIVKAMIQEGFKEIGVKDVEQVVEFPPVKTDWRFIKNPKGITVGSYLVGTNDAGRKLRSDFTAVFDSKGQFVRMDWDESNWYKVDIPQKSMLKKMNE